MTDTKLSEEQGFKDLPKEDQRRILRAEAKRQRRQERKRKKKTNEVD